MNSTQYNTFGIKLIGIRKMSVMGVQKAFIHFHFGPLRHVFILLKCLFDLRSDREQSKIMLYVFVCFVYVFSMIVYDSI